MKNLFFYVLTAGVVFSVFLALSCSKNNSVAPVATVTVAPTLYDSLGGVTLVADPTHSGAMIEKGRLGIRSVIDSTIFVIAADTKINPLFTVLLSEVGKGNLTGFTALSNNLTVFVAVGSGAKDYTYTGLSMTAAHNPATNSRISAKVTAAQFSQFVNDVVAGANKNKLPANLINSLGKILVSLQAQVVQG